MIEGFLYKKAKTHNRENYLWLKKLLGQEKISSVEAFSKHSFTYEDPEFVSNLSFGFVPMFIPELKPSNLAYWFFNRDIQITSSKVNFEECEILVPKMQILKITNKNSSSLLIRDILTSSPEVTIYL